MSIDRAVGVGGVSIGLIGTGIVALWPDKRWLGWVFIGVGVFIAVLSVVWALAVRYAHKQFESSAVEKAAPSQRLTQHAPITNTNNPIFAPVFAPNFTQSQSQSQHAKVERVATRDPVFECRGTRFRRYGLDTQTGKLIREQYDGDPSQVYDHIKFVEVALARFLYRPDPGIDPRLRVSAHVFICNDDQWPQKDEAMPQFLIPKLWNDVRCKLPAFWFDLSLLPQPTFTFNWVLS